MGSSEEEIKKALKSAVVHHIDTINWEDFPYRPQVAFQMGYSDDSFYILYHVKEDAVRAVVTENNGRVSNDSCCEMFCSFDGVGYYNLEINCIGIKLLGYRTGAEDKKRASDDIVDSITCYSSLGNKPFDTKEGGFEYTLLVNIPVSVFFAHKLTLEKGMSFTANFYKCGDLLPQKHYLSWNAIKTGKPNFHQPVFFGEVELV